MRKSIRVVTVASNFPDEYNKSIAPWSKKQVDSIYENGLRQMEVIVPRPISVPIRIFPYSNFYKLPKKTTSNIGYIIHYPRFLYLIPKRLFFSLTGNFYSLKISKYLLENIEKPNLVHARFGYLDGYGVLKACKKWNVPLVFDVHGKRDFGQYYKSLILSKKQKKTINYAKKILCVAKWQLKKGIELGIPKNKLEYVPLGVDTKKFKQFNNEKIKENLKISENNILLFVGHLTKEKGVFDLIKGFSGYIKKSNDRNTRLILVGYGHDSNALKEYAKNLGLLQKITFAGVLHDLDLRYMYSLADIFILPSYSEGKPSVINEAMSSECAIIATKVGGIPEQVKEGYNGFLIDNNNSDKLADSISMLINDDNLLSKMKKNSRKRIFSEKLTWKMYAKQIINIYKEITK